MKQTHYSYLLKASFGFCLAIFFLGSSMTVRAEEDADDEPTPFQIGMAKRVVREFSPEAGRLLDQLSAASAAKDKAQIDAVIQSLNALGVDRSYTQALDQAAQISNGLDDIAETLGEGLADLIINGLKSLDQPSQGSSNSSYGGGQNLVKGSDGKWRPAPGYRWLNSVEGDFRVVWTPGQRHTEDNRLIAQSGERTWEPESGYTWLHPEDNKDLRVVEAVIVGIGAVMEIDDASGRLSIERVIPGSPASRAGLRAGLLIQSIDGVSTASLPLSSCVSRIRGEAGSTVVLEAYDRSSGSSYRVSMVRQAVNVAP